MADYTQPPTVEDLLGAGLKLEEAVAVLRLAKDEQWHPSRFWAFVLKHSSKSFPKLDDKALAEHLKQVTGTDQLAVMG